MKDKTVPLKLDSSGRQLLPGWRSGAGKAKVDIVEKWRLRGRTIHAPTSSAPLVDITGAVPAHRRKKYLRLGHIHISQKDMDPELGSVANAPKIVFVSEPGITDLLLLTDAAQGDSFGSQEGLVHPHKRARCCTASAQT